ncbi:MAG: DUF3782 domain-containing protein [Anaerolineales bacterium]|nr:DUF3782 domain-containing protein [Anaerolineales bacterium]MCS7248797.1 DUF3782 domain-containing protein [Anaerolineales bacterium]MDW8162610.1 DUF3782 domain-containing protein [Anaerolineales bacterium]MDW8445762.1 DUF3782 domain-containing protein [Anaerolineales bacterium]
MESEHIKQIILQELPRLIEKDPEVREAVLRLSREHFASRAETRDRFEQLLEEIRQMRAESERKWEEFRNELQEYRRRWEENDRRWEEGQRRLEEYDRRWEEGQRRWEENERKWEEFRNELREYRRRWEESDRRWEESQRRWEENERKWQEDQRRWEENERKWEDFRRELQENHRRWEENERKWQEDQRRWEENERKWEENQQVIRQLIAGVQRLGRKIDTTLGALGARWGLYTEQAFRNALQAMLKEFAGLEVINVTEWDETGEVFGYPEQVELDLIIKDGLLILGEIKSSVSRGEVYLFERKVRLYERLHNCKADRLIIISPMVEPKALEVAQRLGIEVYTHADEAGEALSTL